MRFSQAALESFTIKFETKDGCLIMDRQANRSYWVMNNGQLDKDFAECSMSRDASEKGVKVLSYKFEKTGITAIVDYL